MLWTDLGAEYSRIIVMVCLRSNSRNLGEGVWSFENTPSLTRGHTVPGESSIKAEEGHLRPEWMVTESSVG